MKNYQKELKTNHKHEKYALPDGQIITIGQERFKCPEALFNPSLLRKEIPGIHELIKNTIDNCDITIRKNLYKNIILSGGTTTFKGFKNRLELELENLVNKNTTIKIINPLQRKYTVWIGGSILGSLETFSNYFVTKKEWEEYGNSIIHKKFN